jgi:hypothetical protein
MLRFSMQIRGMVRSADLQEHPPGSERIELVLSVQGVSPGQPRKLVVPYEFLLRETLLAPEDVQGRGFAAIVREDESGRWVVEELTMASRVLRAGQE